MHFCEDCDHECDCGAKDEVGCLGCHDCADKEYLAGLDDDDGFDPGLDDWDRE